MAAPKGNQYALGADSGRPPVFETPEAFAVQASEYFEGTKIKDWTITGLTLHLGFCDRQSLYDYQKKEEFSGIVKKCRLMVEMAYEKKLSTREVGGAIFALKNMGWADKSEVKTENMNYNSRELSPEEIREIGKALEDDC